MAYSRSGTTKHQGPDLRLPGVEIAEGHNRALRQIKTLRSKDSEMTIGARGPLADISTNLRSSDDVNLRPSNVFT